MYGERLRQLRKERNLTLDELSAIINVNRSTYSGYERKVRQPPLEFITRIAQFYGVTTDYILGLSDERNLPKLQYDVEQYFNKKNLNWGGKPLNEEDLEPIRKILERLAIDKIPLEMECKEDDDNKE